MEPDAGIAPAGKLRISNRGLLSPHEKRRLRTKILLAFGALLLALGALAAVGPVLWMFLGSLKTPAEIYSIPPKFLPGKFSLENYADALRLVPFDRYLLNSLFICACVVVGQLLINSMAAYSLSKLRMRFSSGILLLMMTSLMVPLEVLVIPLYLIIRYFPFGAGLPHANLINTYWALILPGLFSAFSIIVMKDFFDSIPDDILNAARIDGCTEWKIFSSFLLPMAKPIASFLAVFSFVTTWNSFFWPLIALNNPDYYPLVLGVQKLIDSGEPWNVVMAALALSALPSILLLVFFQRAFMRGIAYTGIYG